MRSTARVSASAARIRRARPTPASCPPPTGRTTCSNYEAGHQEPVVRQPAAAQRLRCSSWSGTTSSSDSAARATATTTAPGGSKATSTAARPSRRASSSTASGTRPNGSASSGARSSRAPSSRRTRSCPNTDEVYIAEGTTMPVSPKEKYWAAVEYTFPDFLPLQGDFWTRFSYTWQSQVWDSLTRDRGLRDADDPEEKDEALEFLIPAWKSGTFQIGFTSDNGWDTAFIVRNVFDDAGYTYLSSTWYGEDFGDPRWRHIRNLQRPRSYSLVVHQEMVTRPPDARLSVEARHDLGRARQPPGREPWRRLPDRPRRARGPSGRSTGTTPASTGRAAAGTAGLRGIAFDGETVYIAASDELFAYTPRLPPHRLLAQSLPQALPRDRRLGAAPVPGLDRLRRDPRLRPRPQGVRLGDARRHAAVPLPGARASTRARTTGRSCSTSCTSTTCIARRAACT